MSTITKSIDFTRTQYLNGECTHNQYYAQFITCSSAMVFAGSFGIGRLKKAVAQDEHFNSIPLKEWDKLAENIHTKELVSKMKEAGDYVSKGSLVCILKCAARQLIK